MTADNNNIVAGYSCSVGDRFLDPVGGSQNDTQVLVVVVVVVAAVVISYLSNN